MKYTKDDLENMIALCEQKENCIAAEKLTLRCKNALAYSDVSIRLTKSDRLFLASLYDEEMDKDAKATLDKILSNHNT